MAEEVSLVNTSQAFAASPLRVLARRRSCRLRNASSPPPNVHARAGRNLVLKSAMLLIISGELVFRTRSRDCSNADFLHQKPAEPIVSGFALNFCGKYVVFWDLYFACVNKNKVSSLGLSILQEPLSQCCIRGFLDHSWNLPAGLAHPRWR